MILLLHQPCVFCPINCCIPFGIRDFFGCSSLKKRSLFFLPHPLNSCTRFLCHPSLEPEALRSNQDRLRSLQILLSSVKTPGWAGGSDPKEGREGILCSWQLPGSQKYQAAGLGIARGWWDVEGTSISKGIDTGASS